MKQLIKLLVCFAAVTSGALLSADVAAQKRLTIASGGTGGVYHPLGGAVAKMLATYQPDTTACHEATSASVDNIRMVAAGKADIAFTQADTAWDAYKGYGPFQAAGPQPIRTIAVLYPNSLQVVTTAGSGINKISDLRGKRISTGAKGSGTEIWGYRLLEASGIDPAKDIVDHKLLVGPSWAGGARVIVTPVASCTGSSE
jgi:TRAP transporter TAXI family solute receptor